MELKEDTEKAGSMILTPLLQRFASSKSSEAASPFYLTATASGATIAAVGLAAYSWQLIGQDAYAMTPAEEG